MKKIMITSLFLFSIIISGLYTSTVSATEYDYDENGYIIEAKPGYGLMAMDFFVGRPLSLVASVAGSLIFVATLPFSYAGDNYQDAADVLVRQPLYNTFFRCLGCSSSEELESLHLQEEAKKRNKLY